MWREVKWQKLRTSSAEPAKKAHQSKEIDYYRHNKLEQKQRWWDRSAMKEEANWQQQNESTDEFFVLHRWSLQGIEGIPSRFEGKQRQIGKNFFNLVGSVRLGLKGKVGQFVKPSSSKSDYKTSSVAVPTFFELWLGSFYGEVSSSFWPTFRCQLCEGCTAVVEKEEIFIAGLLRVSFAV